MSVALWSPLSTASLRLIFYCVQSVHKLGSIEYYIGHEVNPIGDISIENSSLIRKLNFNKSIDNISIVTHDSSQQSYRFDNLDPSNRFKNRDSPHLLGNGSPEYHDQDGSHAKSCPNLSSTSSYLPSYLPSDFEQLWGKNVVEWVERNPCDVMADVASGNFYSRFSYSSDTESGGKIADGSLIEPLAFHLRSPLWPCANHKLVSWYRNKLHCSAVFRANEISILVDWGRVLGFNPKLSMIAGRNVVSNGLDVDLQYHRHEQQFQQEKQHVPAQFGDHVDDGRSPDLRFRRVKRKRIEGVERPCIAGDGINIDDGSSAFEDFDTEATAGAFLSHLKRYSAALKIPLDDFFWESVQLLKPSQQWAYKSHCNGIVGYNDTPIDQQECHIAKSSTRSLTLRYVMERLWHGDTRGHDRNHDDDIPLDSNCGVKGKTHVNSLLRSFPVSLLTGRALYLAAIDRSYVKLLPRSEYHRLMPKPKSKRKQNSELKLILFDLGAGQYDAGDTGSSTKWLLEQYANLGWTGSPFGSVNSNSEAHPTTSIQCKNTTADIEWELHLYEETHTGKERQELKSRIRNGLHHHATQNARLEKQLEKISVYPHGKIVDSSSIHSLSVDRNDLSPSSSSLITSTNTSMRGRQAPSSSSSKICNSKTKSSTDASMIVGNSSLTDFLMLLKERCADRRDTFPEIGNKPHKRTFCVLKIDIDDPVLEDKLIGLLFGDTTADSDKNGIYSYLHHVDEFLWEPHTHTLFNLNMQPLYDGASPTTQPAYSNRISHMLSEVPTVDFQSKSGGFLPKLGDFQTPYRVLRRMRSQFGVRAHGWI